MAPRSCATCAPTRRPPDPASPANAQEALPEVRARRVQQGVPSGKQWQLHQLLGAIDVTIPLDKVEVFAAVQNRITLAVIIGVVGAGVGEPWILGSLDVNRSRRNGARARLAEE